MKTIIAITGFVVLLSGPQIWSQSLTPQVYSSGGQHSSGGTSQLTSTIGEPLTSSYSAASLMVTQGFEQPEQSTSGISENETVYFNVYPNPSQDLVTISTTQQSISQYTAEIIDNLGQMVSTKILSGNNQQIDVSALAAGTYHLRVTFLQNKSNSFTLIKTLNK